MRLVPGDIPSSFHASTKANEFYVAFNSPSISAYLFILPYRPYSSLQFLPEILSKKLVWCNVWRRSRLLHTLIRSPIVPWLRLIASTKRKRLVSKWLSFLVPFNLEGIWFELDRIIRLNFIKIFLHVCEVTRAKNSFTFK